VANFVTARVSSYGRGHASPPTFPPLHKLTALISLPLLPYSSGCARANLPLAIGILWASSVCLTTCGDPLFLPYPRLFRLLVFSRSAVSFVPMQFLLSTEPTPSSLITVLSSPIFSFRSLSFLVLIPFSYPFSSVAPIPAPACVTVHPVRIPGPRPQPDSGHFWLLSLPLLEPCEPGFLASLIRATSAGHRTKRLHVGRGIRCSAMRRSAPPATRISAGDYCQFLR